MSERKTDFVPRHENAGLIGAIVERFLEGRLSILLIILSTMLGLAALYITPREEEPQIVVPMADLIVSAPGASAEEVERLVTTPLERLLWQIDGVEHVYSTSWRDRAVVTVRFFVGEDREDSLLKLHNRVQTHLDLAPPIVQGWAVKPVEIDDVPIVTLTLAGEEYNDHDLRRIGEEVLARLDSLPDLSRTEIVGGRRRAIRVEIDQERLAGYGLSLPRVSEALRAADASIPAGSFDRNNASVNVRSGQFLSTMEELHALVVGVHESRPVYLRDVATIVDGPEENRTYTRFTLGPAGHAPLGKPGPVATTSHAVTLALAKKKGTNAVRVAESIHERVLELQGSVIPDGVQVFLTRDYGETANGKVNELVEGLLIAVITVVDLLAITLGWREALVVAFAIPITYFLTIFCNLLLGYTINRVTLFALTMSLGLLVDDPIVDVENIYRHFRLRIRSARDSVLAAVHEVRPPIILATLAVIVSFLPMFFISGMMGPYMRPMAINVPLTMLMSTVVAFTVTPWMTYRLLRGVYERTGESGEKKFVLQESLVYRIYAGLIGPFLKSAVLRWALVLFVAVLLLGSAALGFFGVPLKMLPFDNKNELQLVLDLPEGTTLESTDAVTREFEHYLSTVPEVRSFVSYVGTASPMDFNGMVRHYYAREGSNVADIRLNLVDKSERVQQSHTIALRLRNDLEAIGRARGAIVKIVEAPPGPPVIATVAAEVYGDEDRPYRDLIEGAEDVTERLRAWRGVTELDSTIETERQRLDFHLDREKAALHGVSTEDVARTIAMALSGDEPATLHLRDERNPLPIRVRLPREERSGREELARLFVQGRGEHPIPLAELGDWAPVVEDQPIYHKDLQRVAYVFAEVAGRAPGEVVLSQLMEEGKRPYPEWLRVVWSGEGEWQITLDVFRDLGLAFLAALVGIYILLVIETESFSMPGIIMLAIPLTMIGIMPGFYLLNLLVSREVGGYPDPVFFTATAMIGMIALAGIVVRNSILLIDFVRQALAEGRALEDALLESGAVRLRPILITAGTTLLGNWVITLDPIFGGLAWSIIFGIFASTAFTLVVIPVVFYMVFKGRSTPGKEVKEP